MGHQADSLTEATQGVPGTPNESAMPVSLLREQDTEGPQDSSLTFHGEHPPAKVLEVDPAQVVGIQVLDKFLHLREGKRTRVSPMLTARACEGSPPDPLPSSQVSTRLARCEVSSGIQEQAGTRTGTSGDEQPSPFPVGSRRAAMEEVKAPGGSLAALQHRTDTDSTPDTQLLS